MMLTKLRRRLARLLHPVEIDPNQKAKIQIAKRWLELRFANKHEIDYWRWRVMGEKRSQIEIDVRVFDHFLKRGGSVLDIGANIGLTALLALEAGATDVTAIEAVPEIFRRLATLEDNAIRVIHGAVAETEGMIELFLSQAHNQGSTIDPETVVRFRRIFGNEIRSTLVPAIVLDDMIDRTFTLWKIDIEGAELPALRGAARALAEHAPEAIYTEIYDPGNLREIMALTAQTLPHAYRVNVRKDDGGLVFTPLRPDGTHDRLSGASRHSPSYVFCRQKQVG